MVGTLGLVLVTATFCGGSTTGGAQPDASSATPDAAAEAQVDSGCTANPCLPGESACPGYDTPIPAAGDPCSPAGTLCYGYGSMSCPVTLTCSEGGAWQVSCPLHPFGTDSGSCVCSP